jgi:hypothetical protein
VNVQSPYKHSIAFDKRIPSEILKFQENCLAGSLPAISSVNYYYPENIHKLISLLSLTQTPFSFNDIKKMNLLPEDAIESFEIKLNRCNIDKDKRVFAFDIKSSEYFHIGVVPTEQTTELNGNTIPVLATDFSHVSSRTFFNTMNERLHDHTFNFPFNNATAVPDLDLIKILDYLCSTFEQIAINKNEPTESISFKQIENKKELEQQYVYSVFKNLSDNKAVFNFEELTQLFQPTNMAKQMRKYLKEEMPYFDGYNKFTIELDSNNTAHVKPAYGIDGYDKVDFEIDAEALKKCSVSHLRDNIGNFLIRCDKVKVPTLMEDYKFSHSDAYEILKQEIIIERTAEVTKTTAEKDFKDEPKRKSPELSPLKDFFSHIKNKTDNRTDLSTSHDDDDTR